MSEIGPEMRVQWRELLRTAGMIQLVRHTEENCPVGFKIGGTRTMEQVALESAHAEGWRDCVRFLKALAEDERESAEMPFLNTSKD